MWQAIAVLMSNVGDWRPAEGFTNLIAAYRHNAAALLEPSVEGAWPEIRRFAKGAAFGM